MAAAHKGQDPASGLFLCGGRKGEKGKTGKGKGIGKEFDRLAGFILTWVQGGERGSGRDGPEEIYRQY